MANSDVFGQPNDSPRGLQIFCTYKRIVWVIAGLRDEDHWSGPTTVVFEAGINLSAIVWPTRIVVDERCARDMLESRRVEHPESHLDKKSATESPYEVELMERSYVMMRGFSLGTQTSSHRTSLSSIPNQKDVRKGEVSGNDKCGV